MGYGPTMWVNSRKALINLHDHDSKAGQRVACRLCREQRRYQGRGMKRTIFLLVERGGPIGKVLVHRWLPECHQQKQQGLTDRVVHRGVYISNDLLLLRSYRSQERFKQINGKENVIIRSNRTMERKMCLNTYFKGISFQRTSRA